MTLTGSLQIDLNAPEYNHLRRTRNDNPPVTFPISFARGFSTPPAVILSLTGFHGGGDPFRFRFEPAQITTFGFTLMLYVNRNWVESLQISWLAADA